MAQSPDIQPNVQAESQSLPREELVQLAVHQIRDLLNDGQADTALARFRQLYPVDQGDVLENMAESGQVLLLEALSPRETADILEEMEPQAAADVSKEVPSDRLARILEQTSTDFAADILQLLPEENLEQTLQAMSDAQEVTSLLQYRTDSAGGLMTLDYPVVREMVTSPNALDQLRLLGPEAENINSLLVVDDHDRLVGSLSIARLALARPTSVVGDIAEHDVISVTAETDQEECARLMERYNLIQLPVVDQNGRLTGVILAQDMVDVVVEEATEDMYRMAGVAGERVMGPLGNSLRRRLPWLYINLATVLLAGLMISFFESTIFKFTALAVVPAGGSWPRGYRRHSDRHLGGPQHGLGRTSTELKPKDTEAGGGPWADQRGPLGVGGGAGSLWVEEQCYLGGGAGGGDAGQHAGGGPGGSGSAPFAAPAGSGPGRILGSVCNHIHRRNRILAVSRAGRRVYLN